MPKPIDPELDAIRRRAPIGGLFVEAETSASLDDPGPEEGARTVRHVKAIRDVEASGTPHETAIVERIHERLRAMPSWDADTVRDLLNEAGVPDTLEIRRRYASRCVNGLTGKRKLGTRMTRHQARSGRPVTVWTCQPEDGE